MTPIEFLHRRRAAIESMTTGLRDYLMVDVDFEIEAIEAEPPPPDRDTVIRRLTEDLMRATAGVQMAEANVQQIQIFLSELDPQTAGFFKQFEPFINSILMPYLQGLHMKAVRKREDIQAELTAMEEEAQV
jgi:uncharacterized protein (DUF2164 family)